MRALTIAALLGVATLNALAAYAAAELSQPWHAAFFVVAAWASGTLFGLWLTAPTRKRRGA